MQILMWAFIIENAFIIILFLKRNVVAEYFELRKQNRENKRYIRKLEDNLTILRRDLKFIRDLAEGNKNDNELLIFRRIAEQAEDSLDIQDI